MRKILLLGFFVLIATALSPVAWSAPKLDLHTLDGKPKDLDVFVGKGRWVLVMFWATTCPICEEQKPVISRFHDLHKNDDAEVVGVVIDGLDKKKAIEDSMRRNPMSFPTLVAELGLLSMNYQIAAGEPFRGTPTYWLFNPSGELVGVNPGPLRIQAIEKFIEAH